MLTVVGAGLHAEGGLLASFYWEFSGAAATVFAGEPAPTPSGGGLRSGWGCWPVFTGGLAGLRISYSRVNPLLRRAGVGSGRGGAAGQFLLGV
ncbi:hypothetical protein C4Q27_19005 [Pseudomonas sp. SWI36]|nr:hypothetical protein C4Q27_19005 [Pseudomonas sp. SWI36]